MLNNNVIYSTNGNENENSNGVISIIIMKYNMSK